MSEQNECLLIDIGNSRIKYATCLEQSLSDVNVIEPDTDLKALVNHKHKVIISAVKQNDMLDDVIKEATRAGAEVIQVKTEPRTLGLVCAYKNYSKLGVDRWLSMLALHNSINKPFAIMDLGTASTCDFVKGHQHLGGWIAPGYDLMRSSLVSNTFQVTADQEYPDSLILGDTTESCVNHGCLAYIVGMVTSAEQKLRELDDDYHLFIDGGSHALLESVVSRRVTMAKNLVFKGLMRFTQS